jgi:hypothetical protein
MERINNTVIIALYFIKKINRPEEEVKTDQPGE